MRATLHGYRAGGFLLRRASDPHPNRPAIAPTTDKRHRATGRAQKTRGKQPGGHADVCRTRGTIAAGQVGPILRRPREPSVRGETMWRALRDIALRIRKNEDVRELTRGVAIAFGWLIVSAIIVLIAGIIVSALF